VEIDAPFTSRKIGRFRVGRIFSEEARDELRLPYRVSLSVLLTSPFLIMCAV